MTCVPSDGFASPRFAKSSNFPSGFVFSPTRASSIRTSIPVCFESWAMPSRMFAPTEW
jgi:hypothetical protein